MAEQAGQAGLGNYPGVKKKDVMEGGRHEGGRGRNMTAGGWRLEAGG